LPCYKLGLRFGRADMVRRFLASGRTGYYLAVDIEGAVAAGDPVEIIARHPGRISVAEITRAYVSDRDDLAAIERLARLDALPIEWRRYFAKRLEKSTRSEGRHSTNERNAYAHAP
jgi:MOSC domain-containing protein YiiM